MNSRIQLFRKKKNEENSAKAQYSLQGNSMTEEEQRIVNEAKANGTFDASNPDIRYSLASDMARDAVMTALEGAGIDVEMATPEMVEDVLRARDAEFMSAKKEEHLKPSPLKMSINKPSFQVLMVQRY